MKRILIGDLNLPDHEAILEEAASWIKAGELVAFPTETVYGLGSNAMNDAAVKKIFAAKGRPSDNPLIIHIANQSQLKPLVEDIPELAFKLISVFWPGPLTLIFKKSNLVPAIVTAGGSTVAIRMPNNKISLKLIEMSNVPIAAPSANSSGKPSPTKAYHVEQDLGDQNILLIDGGSTSVGLESTVLDVSEPTPVLLRSGGVSVEEIEKVIGKIVISSEQPKNKSEIAKSPGLKYRHYAPMAKVIIVKPEDLDRVIFQNSDKKLGVITLQSREKFVVQKNIKMYNLISVEEMAQKLFAIFRDCDQMGIKLIVVEQVEQAGIGRAIVNRIQRASQTEH